MKNRSKTFIAALLFAPSLMMSAYAEPSQISSNLAAASPVTLAPITEAEVAVAQAAWGNGIVAIGDAYTKGKDYRSAAAQHINQFYAYGESDVLFRPTLAADDQFRGNFDEALSYFVGGSITEDNGFAIAPYTNVRWENEGTLVYKDSAKAMGNYYFTKSDGEEVKVEYSFGYIRGDDGNLKIVLHHSSLPFSAG